MLKISGVFRIRKSKDRQHNDQTKKDYKNNLQNIKRNTKDLATRKSIRDEHMCSGRVSSSCSTSGTRCVALIANSQKRGVLTANLTYSWSFMTQIFPTGQPSHGGDRKTFEVMQLKLAIARHCLLNCLHQTGRQVRLGYFPPVSRICPLKVFC